MILVLTSRTDTHADAVIDALLRRGERVFRFDVGDFPTRAELSLRYTKDGLARQTLRAGDDVLDLDTVSAVWYRRPNRPEPHANITDELARQVVADECFNLANDLWNSLDCRWVPAPPAVLRRAELKALQLKIAGTLGFELPPTLITNRPEDLLEFYRDNEYGGELVSKRVGVQQVAGRGATFVRYTNAVTRRELGYADSIRYCPMIFQAYVPKRVELRITVVGDQVFAAEIHSQESHHTRHDWRRYDMDKTRHLPHRLPADVAERCRRLVAQLGLTYGAIDMIVTPEGRYVFVEINPNGQYLWIEMATGLPIGAAMGELLSSISNQRGRAGGTQ